MLIKNQGIDYYYNNNIVMSPVFQKIFTPLHISHVRKSPTFWKFIGYDNLGTIDFISQL